MDEEETLVIPIIIITHTHTNTHINGAEWSDVIPFFLFNSVNNHWCDMNINEIE